MPCVEKSWLYWSGVSKRQIRTGKLQPHDQRLDAAERQKDERRDDVADADLFVIDRGEEPLDAGRCLPQALQARLVLDAVDIDGGRS